MNLNLYGHGGGWLMVDCGVMFDGDDVMMADPQFITKRREHLAGIIVTHAHQDHIGAMVEVWNRCRVPIYTTPFTAFILRRSFAEAGLSEVPIVTVNSRETLDIGPFTVRWLPITHSTPETHALLISTQAATVLHTADWKIDRYPVVEPGFDHDQFAMLGQVDAVVCDSTNAISPGTSISEGDVRGGLQQVVQQAAGRVVVSCFASNVARLQTLGSIAARCGRYIGVMGRSLNTMAQAGRACRYLDDDFRPISVNDLGYLPRNEVLAIASGSQGEAGAALSRLANDSHPGLNLDAGDLVVFSARTIPGNEKAIAALVSRFRDRGIHVVHADDYELPVHASGHACQDELASMYRWVKPVIAIPVHGEAEHIAQNAAIAKRSGVPAQLQGRNGDLFVIAGAGAPRVRSKIIVTGRITRSD